MAWSYNPVNIKDHTMDRMRFELGDVQVEGEGDTCALSDEEYQAMIDMHSSWKQAKIACLRAIVMRFSMSVDFNAGGMSIDMTKRYERWKQMLDSAEKGKQFISAHPSALGSNALDGGHYFRYDMHANPLAAIGAGDKEKR